MVKKMMYFVKKMMYLAAVEGIVVVVVEEGDHLLQ
jgi:hypothetical protein